MCRFVSALLRADGLTLGALAIFITHVEARADHTARRSAILRHHRRGLAKSRGASSSLTSGRRAITIQIGGSMSSRYGVTVAPQDHTCARRSDPTRTDRVTVLRGTSAASVSNTAAWSVRRCSRDVCKYSQFSRRGSRPCEMKA
jgi:hypothetical protein